MSKPTSPVQLGDLITAAYDAASQYSGDPREASRLAAQAVSHLLRRARTIGPHRSVH